MRGHRRSRVASAHRADPGRSFAVKLPIRALRDGDAAHPISAASPIARAALLLTDIRVLIVDDDPDARDLLGSVLAGVAAVPSTAGSTADALAAFADQPFDLIISDIGMPEHDGYQLMRAIRALPPERGGKTPAIAVTALAPTEDRMRALLAGYQVHLAKPIELHELVITVASLTGKVPDTEA